MNKCTYTIFLTIFAIFIYVPFSPHISGKCIVTEPSVYEVPSGKYDFSSCESTVYDDIPHELADLNIICNDISETGIGSSYMPHTFSLDTNENSATNLLWKFLLKKNDGTFDEFTCSSEIDFTIGPISSPQDYYINSEGNLEGRIECFYTLYNKEYEATPFIVFLGLKPIIKSIDNFSVEHNDYSFSLSFDVNYEGSEMVVVEVEEEFNTSLRTYNFYEPLIAHVTTGNISSLYYSWVTVIVTNKYGTAYETFEFVPDNKNNSGIDSIGIDNICTSDSQTYERVRLTKLDGSQVYYGPVSEYTEKYLIPGIYIRTDIYIDGKTNTKKIIVR